jgi:hypothetical protein
MIGQTRIDLEDRYYSNCYATCGLPRKFEMNGYNAWRDALFPKQILAKYCKKFSLQAPIYDSKKVMIYDVKGTPVYSSRIRYDEDDEDDFNLLQTSNESGANFEEIEIEEEEEDEEEEESMDSVDSATDDKLNNIKEKQKKLKINVTEEQLALDVLNNYKWKEKFGVSIRLIKFYFIFFFVIVKLVENRVKCVSKRYFFTL